MTFLFCRIYYISISLFPSMYLSLDYKWRSFVFFPWISVYYLSICSFKAAFPKSYFHWSRIHTLQWILRSNQEMSSFLRRMRLWVNLEAVYLFALFLFVDLFFLPRDLSLVWHYSPVIFSFCLFSIHWVLISGLCCINVLNLARVIAVFYSMGSF